MRGWTSVQNRARWPSRSARGRLRPRQPGLLGIWLCRIANRTSRLPRYKSADRAADRSGEAASACGKLNACQQATSDTNRAQFVPHQPRNQHLIGTRRPEEHRDSSTLFRSRTRGQQPGTIQGLEGFHALALPMPDTAVSSAAGGFSFSGRSNPSQTWGSPFSEDAPLSSFMSPQPFSFNDSASSMGRRRSSAASAPSALTPGAAGSVWARHSPVNAH